MSQTFIALTRNPADLEWLQNSLSAVGQVLESSGDSLDALLALVDVTAARLVFVGLDRSALTQQSALIEDLMEARPMLAVVALGDGLDNQLVLSAMRAGARDFVAYGSRASEVAGLVRRLSKRAPQVQPDRRLARLTALYCSAADADAGLIASHLALTLERSGSHTLLLDLGLPRGECMAVLGLESSFHFEDALRNIRRLDTSLIDSAFCRHANGLRLLSANTEVSLATVSGAELLLLLSALRQHFQHILINLAGQPDSGALRLLLGQAEQLLWTVDQSVPNCRRNLDQLATWRASGVQLDHSQLIVDRYLRGVTPNDQDVVRCFDLPLLAVLPFSPELRLNAKNQGRSLFETAPRDRLTQRLKQLGQGLSKVAHAPSPSRWARWWRAGQ